MISDLLFSRKSCPGKMMILNVLQAQSAAPESCSTSSCLSYQLLFDYGCFVLFPPLYI